MNCPFCNNEISDKAKFCGKCGGKIPERGTVNLNPTTNQMPPRIHRCQGCGAEMTGNGDYCGNCRTRGIIDDRTSRQPKKVGPSPKASVTPATPPPLPPQPPKKKKSVVPTILLILLCILLSGSAIFLGYSFLTKSFIFEESTEEKTAEEDTTSISEDTEATTTDVSEDTEATTEAPATPIKIAQQYRKDAEEYNGHAYAIFNFEEEGLTSFNGCERFCESMGGHLAVIDDAAENEFLYKYVQSCGLKLAFFGYTDQDQEGKWKWVNGSTSTYTNWCQVYGKEQPNNGKNNSTSGGENYAEFYKDTADGTWNDAIFGKNTYRFICEWE